MDESLKNALRKFSFCTLIRAKATQRDMIEAQQGKGKQKNREP
jgi:hypothetical protein